MLLLRTSRGVDPGIPLLRSLGSNAHVWAPGANGTTVASLPSNNYLLSDGSTGYSTVDGVDGLDLDGMGSLGSELVTNGDFSAGTTGWTLGTEWSLTGSSVTTAALLGDGDTARPITQAASLTVGKTYKITLTLATNSVTSGSIVFRFQAPGDPAKTILIVSSGTALGSYTAYLIATTANIIITTSAGSLVGTAAIDNISVKEYTGTHLTQATTANKPLVRRGMLNLLLNSATPATQSVTCIAAPYTLALYGTGNVVLSGTGAGTLTGTGASDLVVLNFTPTAGSVTFTKAGTVSSFGLFKGTWTAAQILAEGGIPTTTATAASSPTSGKYWWSFDGSNDSLLSGNLGITNACTIVIAGRVDALGAVRVFFAEDTNGVTFYVGAAGRLEFGKQGISLMTSTADGVIVAGVPFVITARLSSGTAVIRKNGAQIATAATGLTFSATTGGRVGTGFNGTSFPTGGGFGWVVPIAAALSDADCLTVERLVGQQFPGMATF